MKTIRFLRDFHATHMLFGVAHKTDKDKPYDLSAVVTPGPTGFTTGQRLEVRTLVTRSGPVLVNENGAVLDQAIQGRDFEYLDRLPLTSTR